MDTLEGNLAENAISDSMTLSQVNQDDQSSVASDDSFEASSPPDSETESFVFQSSTSQPEAESQATSPMTASEIEVLTMSNTSEPEDNSSEPSFLESSGYVITPAKSAEANFIESSEVNKSSSDSAEEDDEVREIIDLSASTDSEQIMMSNNELEDVMGALESFLKPIGNDVATDDMNNPEEETFPNMDGAGDHSKLKPSSADEFTMVPAQSTNKQSSMVTDVNNEDDLDEDDFEDETIAERLWALSEMFPESVRNGSGRVFDFSCSSAKFAYKWGRKSIWVGVTSLLVLYMPLAIEVERLQMEKESLGQAQDILLGDSQKDSPNMEPPLPTVS